jgi:hypothetical protein
VRSAREAQALRPAQGSQALRSSQVDGVTALDSYTRWVLVYILIVLLLLALLWFGPL